MWTYGSQFNYLVTHTTMWFASVLALWALFATSQSGRVRLLCAVPFLLVWGLVVYDGSRLIH